MWLIMSTILIMIIMPKIGSIMNILKFNPNHHEQRFPYLKINDKPSDLIIDDNLNIGVIWEASRDSNAHDDNSINSELLASVIWERKYNLFR